MFKINNPASVCLAFLNIGRIRGDSGRVTLQNVKLTVKCFPIQNIYYGLDLGFCHRAVRVVAGLGGGQAPLDFQIIRS